MLFDGRYSEKSGATSQVEAKVLNENSPAGHPAESGAAQAAAPAPPEDFLRMKEWIRGIQSDAEQARAAAERNRIDQHELRSQLDSLSHRTSRGSLTSWLLFAILAGAGAYGYRQLQDQVAPLDQIPSLRQMIDSAGQRLSAAENHLQDWTGKWAGLSDRLARNERVVSANLKASKEFATLQASRAQQQMQAELVNRSQELEHGLSNLQASQDRDRAVAAGLQSELADWKQQADGQFAQVRAAQERGDAELSARIGDNSEQLAAVHRTIDRQRVNFELRKEQTLEVAPGVTMTVSKTDVAHQRIEGRIHVVPDGRILWVRSLGIQQPATFYTHNDERPYQIIFTRVAKDAALGYVLIPAQQG